MGRNQPPINVKDILSDALVLLVIGMIGFGAYVLLKPSLHKVWTALHIPIRRSEPVPVGTPADYQWSVQALDGKEVPFSAFKGKVVFLNFWATWCGPCKMEMPSIQKLHEQFKEKDVVFLLVSEQDAKTLRAFAASAHLQAPVYIARKIPDFFHVTALPTTFILSRNGAVAFSFRGAKTWDRKTIVDLINGLLAGQEPPMSGRPAA